jgi:hypothetical protein
VNYSTVSTYTELLRQPVGAPRRRARTNEYESAHQDIFDVYYSGWGDTTLRDQAADLVEEQASLVASRENHVTRDAADAAERLQRMGLLSESIPVVTMVGVHTANGWAALFHGRPTLFIALEYLNDSLGDTILVAHESAHAAHQLLNPALATDTIGERLIGEGIATSISRKIHPSHPESEYFWFDDHHRNWIAECEQASDAIVKTARDHLDQVDERVVERLFSAKNTSSLPPRCGYSLADRLVDHFTEIGGATHREIMTWDSTRMAEYLERGLKAIADMTTSPTKAHG